MPSITLDIKPTDERHKLILQKIRDRVLFTQRQYSSRRSSWTKNENACIAYMPERDVDALRRMDRENNGKPQFTTLVLPYTYASLMSAHTYWTTVFFSRTPIMQFAGRHGETEQQTQALEALIDYQMQVGGMIVPLYIWLLDVGKYGCGIVAEYWDSEMATVSEIVEEDQMIAGMIPTGRKVKKKITRQIPGYEGNRLFNVRPFDFYPDARVPMHKFQDGEYCGRYFELGWADVLARRDQGYYMNVDKLKELMKTTSGSTLNRDIGSSQLEIPTANDIFSRDAHSLGSSVVLKGYEMCFKLVPKEWNLGTGTTTEKWVFTCSSDFSLLIGAQPLGAYHNKFPYNVIEIEPEGYGLVNRGLPEIAEPIQRTMDWLVNSHFYNVRKTINNQFLVDPSRIVMKDLLDPQAGGLIRAKPAAYGTDLRLAISQLQVSDVTRSHIADLAQMMEFGSRATGINDQIMGQLLPQGGRKSATEIRTSSTFGTNRLKTNAEYFSAMGFGPLAEKIVQNSQQYYDLDRKYKIVGDLMLEAGQGFINVNPETIQGFYDFVPVDGTLPIDRFAQANLWKELLVAMQRFPQVMQGYDLGRIFAWVAQLGGLKNINRFKIQQASPGNIAAQVQQGNIVPIPSGRGAPMAPMSNSPGPMSAVGPTA